MVDEAAPVPDLAATLGAEKAGLERELAEIELLVGQARSESSRHEQKRAQALERSAFLATAPNPDVAEIIEHNSQLLTLTRRAAVMESQIDVLEGKQKIILRYRDALVRIGETLARPVTAGTASAGAPPAEPPADAAGPTVLSRLVLTAQEDLRRDIARAMHDGPAQSLTNIVLQAQIVQHLMERDPTLARDEVRELVAMVERTLEATKTFIFDVRPMVLDDLGLVPTLRRVARDRGRRGAIPVEFDSMGQDRRLPMEVESAVFRIVDEAIAAFMATEPEKIIVALDWGNGELEARVRAVAAASEGEPARPPAAEVGEPVLANPDLPPALAAFLEDRRNMRPIEEPTTTSILPADVRRAIAQRAASVGAGVMVSPDGREIRIVVAAPEVARQADA